MCMNDITWFRQVKINPCDSHLLRHPFRSVIILRVLQCEKHFQSWDILPLTGILCRRSTYNQLAFATTTSYRLFQT